MLNLNTVNGSSSGRSSAGAGLRKWIVTGVGALVLASSLAVNLPAQANDDGAVDIGGVHILTLRVGTPGMTLRQRADVIQERMVTILNDPNIKPADIQAVALGKNDAKIMVKSKLLVTVDAQTAKINGTTAMKLAQVWIQHLRIVLPQVNIKPNPNSGEPRKQNNSPDNK